MLGDVPVQLPQCVVRLLSQLTARDVMAAGVISVYERESLASAWELLARGGTDALPVLRGTAVVGIVDHRAMVHARNTRWLDGRPRLVGDALRPATVVGPDTGVADLLDQLADGAVVVCEPPGYPIGVVTSSSLVRCIAGAAPAPLG
jgi:CBS-domain-containing membrane protein